MTDLPNQAQSCQNLWRETLGLREMGGRFKQTMFPTEARGFELFHALNVPVAFEGFPSKCKLLFQDLAIEASMSEKLFTLATARAETESDTSAGLSVHTLPKPGSSVLMAPHKRPLDNVSTYGHTIDGSEGK